MKYLLDTNIVSQLYDRSAADHLAIRERIAGLGETDEVAISILTVYELAYGLVRSPLEKKAVVGKKLDEAQRDFQVLPLASPGAVVFGELKNAFREHRRLGRSNLQKYNVDLLIAATALVGSWILVSNDAAYQDVAVVRSSLVVESWIA